MRTVLFVCSGNTCRSPLAEAIARHWLSQQESPELRGVFVASAGIGASEGMPVSAGTVKVLRNLGIEHEGWSKALTAEMIRKADLVLCMTREHVEAARTLVDEDPGHVQKIQPLDPQRDMTDPIGLGQDAYDSLAERFNELIPKRLEELLADENRSGIRSSR